MKMQRIRIIWRFVRDHAKLNAYWMTIPLKVWRFRKKKCIRVLFMVSEVATWKSELLYLKMCKHTRFDPIIGISTSRVPDGVKKPLADYLQSKKYPFVDLDTSNDSIKNLRPDIVIYYKPYPECYSEGHFFDKNLRYVFIGMNYCFSIENIVIHIEKPQFDYCWQYYVEHTDVADRRREVLGYRARNTKVTGVPMQDILLQPKECFGDPWKDKTGRKRIIYAPHHSFKGTNKTGIEFATFLEMGEPMLQFAKQYSDTVTIAFKPHPLLRMKLDEIWGKERTDKYYQEWAKQPNAQIETGEYVGLFKYSDAIIHDCASFLIEYLYMNKPALYLVSESNDIDELLGFAREGFMCYEHAHQVNDIETFIQNVIAGVDHNCEKRQSFINKQLLPPKGRTACDNILDAILGEK